MKKIFLFILLSIFSFLVLLSQDDSEDEVQYTIIRNSPDISHNFIFHGDLVFEWYRQNSWLGYNFGAFYKFEELASVKVDFNKAFLDKSTPDDPSFDSYSGNVYGEPMNLPKNFFNMELIGEFYFSKNIKEEKKGVYSFKHSTFVNVPYKYQKTISLRLGYSRLATYISNGSEGEFSSGNDFIFSGYRKNLYEDDIRTDIKGGSMLKSNNAVVGISFNKNQDLKFKFDKGRTKRYDSYNTFYIDFIYSLNSSLENMIVAEYVTFSKTGVPTFSNNNDNNEQKVYNEYVIDEHTAKINTGFRMGAMKYNLGGKGANVGFEAGCRPGVGGMMNNFFILFKFGRGFSTLL